MADVGLIAAGAASSAAGSMLAPKEHDVKGQQADYVNNTISHMNGILSTAMNNALSYSKDYTNQAITQQHSYLNDANSNLNTGFNQSQALNAPINLAGLGALDKYQDSLGLARPTMGNAALQQSLFQASSPSDTNLSNAYYNAKQSGLAIPTATTAPDSMFTNATAPAGSAAYNQQAAAANAWQQAYGAVNTTPNGLANYNTAQAYNNGLFGTPTKI